MGSIHLPTSFDDLRLERLLYRDSITRAVKWIKIAFVLACLLLSGYAVWFLVRTLIATPADLLRLEQQIAASHIESTGSTSRDFDRNYEPLRTSTLFGEIGERAAPTPAPTPPPARATVPLALIGTFVSTPQNSIAIIEDQRNKSQDVFGVNETIFEEAKLIQILADRVEIERNGQREFLTIDDAKASVGPSAPSSAVSEQFIIDEEELNEALDNLPLLLTQARAVPYFQDGQAVGLRLFAIRSGSLYEKIGLRNGDILKTINGNSMGDISQALRLFEQLKEQRSLNLVLERNRSEMNFNYTIR